MSSPTVSIIVPAYNVASFIAATLESAFAQTYQDFEIIVVNDGSPDTADLREAVAPYRDRIRYIEQAQGGAARARNTGIDVARGQLLAFLDGDDLWAPTFLESQVPIFAREPDVVLVWADSQPFGDGAGSETLMTLEPPAADCDVTALLLGRCVVVTSTAVARRQTVLNVGRFDDTLPLGEDFDLWLKLAMRGRLLCNRAVLGRRRLHANSLSAVPMRMLRAQLVVRRRFVESTPVTDDLRRLVEAADRHCEAQIALAEGHRLLAEGDAAGARQALTRAARAMPSLKLSAVLRLLAVAPPVAIALHRWRRAAQGRG